MPIIERKKLTKWFIFFSIFFIIAFSVFGIESGEGTEPSEDSSPALDTIYILASPFVLSFLYYFLYSRLNKWLVFVSTPLIGLAMEWLLFKPADVLNESSNLEASLFFAGIWSLILIPPYFLARISEKGKKYLIGCIVFTVLFLGAAIINLVL